MPRRRSQVWAYFLDEGSSKARCNFCSRLLSFKTGSLQNLMRHIRTVHLQNAPKKKKPIKFLHENDIASPSSAENEITALSIDEQIQNIPTTSKIESYYPVTTSQSSINEKTMKQQHLSLAKTIVKNYLPFNIVDSDDLKDFLLKLNPMYKLPSRKAIANVYMPRLYEITKEKVKRSISKAGSFCLTVDGWTSTSNESYIAVTVHFITDYQFKSNLLECFCHPEKHSAKNLADEITRVATEWKINNKIVAVVSDNTAKYTAAVKLTGYAHISCFAHNINLIVQDAIKEIADIQKKIKSIVDFFKRTPQAAEKLKQKQIELNIAAVNVIQDEPTRWISTYDMLQRILDMQEALINIIESNYPKINNLNTSDLIILKQCCNILHVFKSTTDEMCSEKSVAISKAILIYNGLKKNCENTLARTDLESTTKNLCARLLNNITERFSTIESNNVYSFATLLDPRFKHHGFTSRKVFNKVKQDFEAYLVEVCDVRVIEPEQNIHMKIEKNGDNNTENTTDGLWSDFDKVVAQFIRTDDSSSVDILNELGKYLNEALIPRYADPLKWWSQRKNVYPELHQIALKRLCAVNTSVPSERIFSKAGQIITDRRNRLTGKRVPQLLFLNVNV